MNESYKKLIFETERLIVRHFTSDDKEIFFAVNGDEEVMLYIRPAKTKEECDKLLGETISGYKENPYMGRLAAIEKNSRSFVGSFAIIPIPAQPEKIQLGYALLKNFWGKGFATELTKAGISFAFDKLNLDILYGVTEIKNVASQKVLLKSGFKNAGFISEKEKTLNLFSISKIDRAFT